MKIWTSEVSSKLICLAHHHGKERPKW